MSCPQPGDVIELTALSAEGLRDCDIPAGVTFRLHYNEEPAMDPTPDATELIASSEPASPPPAQAADLREASSPALEEGISASMPVEGAPDQQLADRLDQALVSIEQCNRALVKAVTVREFAAA